MTLTIAEALDYLELEHGLPGITARRAWWGTARTRAPPFRTTSRRSGAPIGPAVGRAQASIRAAFATSKVFSTSPVRGFRAQRRRSRLLTPHRIGGALPGVHGEGTTYTSPARMSQENP